MSYTHALGRAAELFQKVRQLERDNTALREEVKEQCTLNAKGSEREYSLRGRIEQLERENAALREKMKVSWDEISVLVNQNAALREVLARAEVLAEYTHFDGRREWRVIECWMYPNDIIVQVDRAAFNAARKEAKP